MSNRFTGSLVVCVAAAGLALGALALESDDEPATAAGTPTSAADTGGYGAANDAGAVADGGEGEGGGAAGAAGTTLEVRDFTFSDTTVAPGGQVTVANADGAVHTVTADGGQFASGEVQGGGSATFQAPGQTGTYPFFCEIHPGMSGTLTVG